MKTAVCKGHLLWQSEERSCSTSRTCNFTHVPAHDTSIMFLWELVITTRVHFKVRVRVVLGGRREKVSGRVGHQPQSSGQTLARAQSTARLFSYSKCKYAATSGEPVMNALLYSTSYFSSQHYYHSHKNVFFFFFYSKKYIYNKFVSTAKWSLQTSGTYFIFSSSWEAVK